MTYSCTSPIIGYPELLKILPKHSIQVGNLYKATHGRLVHRSQIVDLTEENGRLNSYSNA